MKIFRSLFMGLIAGAAFLIDAEAAVPPPQPNFILIMADNLGYGDIEPFGSKLHRTPNLNRMAREGRRLTSFYSASGVCTPSRAAILTGKYSHNNGIKTSLFINPDKKQIEIAKQVGAQLVELHTGYYANSPASEKSLKLNHRIFELDTKFLLQ